MTCPPALRVFRRGAVGLALLMAASAPAWAQTEPTEGASPPITELSPVTVEARSTEEVIQGFVANVSAVHERNGQVARFDGRICPGVVNLPESAAQVINDRIARAALIAGLSIGQPGCEPNVLVIATENSDRLAPQLMRDNRRAFAYHVSYQQRGPRLLDEFSRPGRTVRWWHMTQRDDFGHDAGSRLRAAHETDIFAAMIVVDTSRLGPVTLNALGDYVALTALARLSPDADLQGLDTVLNLFELPPSERPAEMTAWDQAYLEALYSARGASVTSRFQFREIADRMLRRVERSRDSNPAEDGTDGD
jgi:hypothetical protein